MNITSYHSFLDEVSVFVYIMVLLAWIPWSIFAAFFFGVLFLIVLEVTIIYCLFFRNSANNNNSSSVPSVDPYTFPQQLYELITEKLDENSSEGTVILNLFLQFWFRENRYDVTTLSSVAERINSELKDLLVTPLGRIFSSLKIHDIELGSESPTISRISLQRVAVNKELRTLNNFVFEFDISYEGGFYMAIHALMKFNSNTAFVSIKVVKCVGRVRVEFTRIPYTYWCMSFVSPPELELLVESRLEGHSVPQLNRIISIQLKKRINRKFVMPFYKIRSKPFLPTHNLINRKEEPGGIVPSGKLHITVLTLSRIANREGTISCTLFTDYSRWIEDVQSTTNHMYILQIFKRSNKDIMSNESRKLSTGSLLIDRQQDGIRQRLKSMTGLEEHSGMEDIVRRRSFADTTGLLQKLNADNVNRSEMEDVINIHHTKRFSYGELMSCNEQFKFIIGPAVRYLNILVWNHVNDGQSEILIGYVSIPLTNLINSGIGRKRKIFYLNAPNNQLSKNHNYASLATHPGFNPSLCFGDITLGVKFTSFSVGTPSLSSNESTPVSLSPTKNVKPTILFEATAGLDIDSELIPNIHEFYKIIISSQMRCEFCQKKIWFKEASRCLKCGLICHRKCVAKCEKSSDCRGILADYAVSEEESIEIATPAVIINPEIIMTDPDNSASSSLSKNKLSTFLANVKGIRRSGSASNLSPLLGLDSTVGQIHSLPPTPNHSPSPSRKSSFVGDLQLFANEEAADEVEKALNYLIEMPQSEQFLESVKSSGKKLCVNLSPERREKRINEMITKIKTAIDNENIKYYNLEEQKKQTSNTDQLTKLSFEMGKCEERLQALTNMLLHCCSGLQNSQDMSKTPI